MSNMIELEKAYDPQKTEDKIYKLWFDSDYFDPDKLPGAAKRKPYTIIMPPLNANAPIHIGHALILAIEDTIIRYQRLRGKKALWLPGTDHAGFETQVVFEKKLEKEGRSRFQMDREDFYKEIWDFVQQNKYITEESIKKMGCSCDWSRNIFTLDPRVVKIVYETFAQMVKDGLVYRGEKIANWCSKHQTALSDLETRYEERAESLYYLKYGPFTIATARPETKFGDKYVVMHPDDKRYKKYKDGDKIELEWINGPITATVIKDEAIDMKFGTGAMTITPWHDAADFEIARRHNLDKQQIIDRSGRLLDIAGEFAGMKIAQARPLIVEKLQKKGLVEKVDEKYKHNVQVCYKCNTVIEPQIIPQWFVVMTKALPEGRKSLRDMAATAIKKGVVKIKPKHFEKIFMNWMKNIVDWPISRQIVWGIPIPVWFCEKDSDKFEVAESRPTKCPFCGKCAMRQDPDTFDTWFSSGQWPYATLMAHSMKDFRTYFPTSLMQTGYDIIFFWVARMIMLSYYKTGREPFQQVLLNGLVRDQHGQKISKSKGNVIDPLELAAKYGTDALRFALIFSSPVGTDVALSEDKVKGMKHFANKIWNIARYILANTDEKNFNHAEKKPKAKGTNDKDILKKLASVEKKYIAHMENLDIHEAAQLIYQFVWHEFADKYVEVSKNNLNPDLLAYSLLRILKLLHPFLPFVTEEIYQKLPLKNKGLLLVQSL